MNNPKPTTQHDESIADILILLFIGLCLATSLLLVGIF